MVFQNNNKINSSVLLSLILKKFVTQLIKDGKKSKAEKIIKEVFLHFSLKGYSARNLLVLAINNVKPLVAVRKVRVRGKSYQVPFPIQTSRQISFAFKIILRSIAGRKKFISALSEEIINCFRGKSQSIKTKNTLHRLAIQNRMYTKYRWF
jgi:small subunit ribosomal protein S7